MCIAYLSFTIHHKTKRNDADKQRMGLSSRRITSIVQLVTVIEQRGQLHGARKNGCDTKQPNLKDLPGKSTQRRIISHSHCFLTVCEKTRSHHETQRNSEK